MVTQRSVFLFPALLLATALAGCDTTEADERHEAGQVPGTAELSNGLTLSITPGRIHEVEGVAVARAASPTPELRVAGGAGTVRFRVANVKAGSTFVPAPAARRTVNPITVELDYEVPPDGLSIRVEPPGHGPARFALISDLHNNLKTFARFAELVKEWQPDAALCMGDLADHGKTEELDLMVAEFDKLAVPFYTTLGNHDLGGPAADRFLEVIGPTNVAFDLLGVRIVITDTANAVFAPAAYTWLARSLARGSGPALVLSHIPPMEPWGGRSHSFSNRDDALHFVQTMAEGRTTHYFAGHIHSSGDYTMRGIPSTIAGGGGGGMEAFLGEGHFFVKLVVDPFSLSEPIAMERVPLD